MIVLSLFYADLDNTCKSSIIDFPSTKYEGRSLFHFSSSLWFQKSLDNKSNIRITGKAFTKLNEILLRQCTDKAQIKIVVQSFVKLQLKRPSHGKLKQANSCWKTSKSWQSLSFTRVRLVSNIKHGNLQHGRFLSVVALTYNSETEEKKWKNRKRWRNRKVWMKPSLSAEKLARIEASPICCQQFANLFADCFCASLTYQLEFANTSLPTLVCRVKAALGLLIEEERRPYWFPLFHILIFK